MFLSFGFFFVNVINVHCLCRIICLHRVRLEFQLVQIINFISNYLARGKYVRSILNNRRMKKILLCKNLEFSRYLLHAIVMIYRKMQKYEIVFKYHSDRSNSYDQLFHVRISFYLLLSIEWK